MRRFTAFLGMVVLLGVGSYGVVAGVASAAPPVAATAVATAAAVPPAVCYPTCLSTPTIAAGASGLAGRAATSPAGSTAGTPASSVDSTASPSGLAFTGADVVGTVTLALIAVGAGGILVRFSRRSRRLPQTV